jgi:DNA repair photolyase
MEPGTPPAHSMFKVIKKFTDAGVYCGVNIDPIIPLITDSQSQLKEIIDSCHESGVPYVLGALLRLRSDIWERVKIILKSLHNENGIDQYKNTIYQFREPLEPGYNFTVNESYESRVLQNLEEKVLEKGMIFDFPHLIRSRRLSSNQSYNGGQQVTLTNYL